MSGLEIIGLAASVIQIAEVGGKLSVKLFTFTRKVKNANKSIDALSQDIASTGAVLKQLGDALSKDDQVRVCSHDAIVTARNLVDDTNKVFLSLEKLIDGDEKPNNKFLKGISLKQRLKFPFLESKIEEVQANLERLKSSLLVILNVLIFAEQLRNQEALPILKDQRELIKVLAAEKDENEKRYEKILRAIQDKPDPMPLSLAVDDQANTKPFEPSIGSLSTASTFVVNDKEPADPKPTTWEYKDKMQLPIIDLPVGLKRHHERLHHHACLVQNLLSEISSMQYKIDYGIRERMHDSVLNTHWREWALQRQLHAPEHFAKVFTFHEDVERYWTDQLYAQSNDAPVEAPSTPGPSVIDPRQPAPKSAPHHSINRQSIKDPLIVTVGGSRTDTQPNKRQHRAKLVKSRPTADPNAEQGDMVQTILKIIAQETETDISEFHDTASFEDHGMDSLMALTVLGILREQHDIDLEHDFFEKCPTVSHLRSSLGLEKPAALVKSIPTQGVPDHDIRRIVQRVIMEEMCFEANEIDDTTNLLEEGMDDLMRRSIVRTLIEVHDIDIDSQLLVDFPTFRQLHQVLRQAGSAVPAARRTPSDSTMSVSSSEGTEGEEIEEDKPKSYLLDTGGSTQQVKKQKPVKSVAPKAAKNPFGEDFVKALGIVAEEVELDASEIPDIIPLSDLGVDALMATILKDRWLTELEAWVSPEFIQKLPTLTWGEMRKALELEIVGWPKSKPQIVERTAASVPTEESLAQPRFPEPKAAPKEAEGTTTDWSQPEGWNSPKAMKEAAEARRAGQAYLASQLALEADALAQASTPFVPKQESPSALYFQCDRCHKRKTKCLGRPPQACSNCQAAGFDCEWPSQEKRVAVPAYMVEELSRLVEVGGEKSGDLDDVDRLILQFSNITTDELQSKVERSAVA